MASEEDVADLEGQMTVLRIQGELGYSYSGHLCYDREERYIAVSIPGRFPLQPPLWHPRTEFPVNTIVDREHHRTARDAAALSDVPPFGQFDNYTEDRVYREVKWADHKLNVLQLLREIDEGTAYTIEAIEAYSTIILRGMEQHVAIIPGHWSIYGGTYPEFFTKAAGDRGTLDALPNGLECCNGNFHFDEPANAGFHSDMLGRRFWVAHIGFEEHDEDPEDPPAAMRAVSVLDRKYRILYYIDCEPEHRDRRTKAAALMWRLFLACYGLPYTFTAVGLPIPEPNNDVYGVVICLFQLQLLLRGLRGVTVEQLVEQEGIHPITMPVDGITVNPRLILPEHSELRLYQWTKLAPNRADAFHRVEAILGAACANELCIRSSELSGADSDLPGEFPVGASEMWRWFSDEESRHGVQPPCCGVIPMALSAEPAWGMQPGSTDGIYQNRRNEVDCWEIPTIPEVLTHRYPSLFGFISDDVKWMWRTRLRFPADVEEHEAYPRAPAGQFFSYEDPRMEEWGGT